LEDLKSHKTGTTNGVVVTFGFFDGIAFGQGRFFMSSIR
jgi:hypothetical protein